MAGEPARAAGPIPVRPGASSTSARRPWPSRRSRRWSPPAGTSPLVVTGADTRRGRGSATSPSPVKAAALELGLPVVHRSRRCSEADADLGVVVAYGRLIRRPVLERLPMVNLHFSLLPRWRGAAPVERALLAGDARDRRVPDAARGGPRHRAGLRPPPWSRSAPATTAGRAPAGSWSSVGHGAARHDPATPGLHDPRPRRASRPTPPSSTPAELRARLGRSRRPSSTASCASAGRGRRGRGRRLKVLDAEPVDAEMPTGRVSGRPGVARSASRWRTGDGSLRLLTVQPEGKAADGRGGLAATAPTRTGGRAGASTADGGTVRGHERRAVRNRPGRQGAHRVRRRRPRHPGGPQRRGARRAADRGGLRGGRPPGRGRRDRVRGRRPDRAWRTASPASSCPPGAPASPRGT